MVLVRKGASNATVAVQRTRDELHSWLVERGAEPERTQAATLGSFYAAGATAEIVSGLFARRCVLVEGRTEALAIPELLRTWDFDLLRDGIAVVSVDGISNIAKWHRLFTALGVECFCVFDTDSNKAGKDAATLLANRQDIMSALQYDVNNASAENLSAAAISVEEGYATLDPNFEGAMAKLFSDRWLGLCVDAAPLVGDSKPLRARYAAQQLGSDDFTPDVAATFDALARAMCGKEVEQTDADVMPGPTPDAPFSDTTGPAGSLTSTELEEPPF